MSGAGYRRYGAPAGAPGPGDEGPGYEGPDDRGWAAYLESLAAFGMRPGLERVSALLDALGRPQDAYRVIHVVGTNGKSSTTRYCEALLRAHGLRSGCYLSPNISGWTERVLVDGRPVDEPPGVATWGAMLFARGVDTRSRTPRRGTDPCDAHVSRDADGLPRHAYTAHRSAATATAQSTRGLARPGPPQRTYTERCAASPRVAARRVAQWDQSPWEADFAAMRVAPATDWRQRRLASEVWLLCERGLDPTGRRKHYLVSLPSSASLKQLVRQEISTGLLFISRPRHLQG